MIEGSACVWKLKVEVIWGVPHGSVLGSLLCTLYTSEPFNLGGNHIVDCSDDTTIYAVCIMLE